METLLEKAKTLQEWMDEVVYERMGKLLVPQNPKQVAEQLVRLEDAKEIERKLEECQKEFARQLEFLVNKQCGELKQKLQQILDDFTPKFIGKCKAGPPSDYQNLWFLCKEFRDKLEGLLE